MNKNTKIALAFIIIILAIIAIAEIVMILNVKNSKSKIIEYKVTFMTDQTVYKEETVKAGGYVLKPSDPTKEKYEFVEWQNEGRIFDFNTPINSDLILNAAWKEAEENKETITVKFDTDGGTTYSNQIIEKGNKVVKPEDPVKEGYTFVKWTVEGREFDFDTILEEDTTITAIWEQKIESKPEESNTNNNNNNSNNSSSTTVKKPTLSLASGDLTGFTLSIGIEGAYASGHDDIDGWELGEVIDGAIKKFGSYINFKSVAVKLEPGQERRFVARVYKLDSNGNKVYSDFSNEVKRKREVLTPTLTIAAGDISEIQLSIGIEGAYADGHDTIKGWELGEIVGGAIKKFGSYTSFESVTVKFEPGEERTFVARVYDIDSKGNKVYSEFSGQVKHKREILAPTLTPAAGDSTGIEFSIGIEGAYADGNTSISGWELYEKTNGSFTKCGEYTSFSSATIPFEPGQTRTFKARVYVVKSNGEKVYSDYSNEVTP